MDKVGGWKKVIFFMRTTVIHQINSKTDAIRPSCFKKTDSFCNNLQCQEVSRQSIIKRGSLMHYSNAVFFCFAIFLKGLFLEFWPCEKSGSIEYNLESFLRLAQKNVLFAYEKSLNLSSERASHNYRLL